MHFYFIFYVLQLNVEEGGVLDEILPKIDFNKDVKKKDKASVPEWTKDLKSFIFKEDKVVRSISECFITQTDPEVMNSDDKICVMSRKYTTTKVNIKIEFK